MSTNAQFWAGMRAYREKTGIFAPGAPKPKRRRRGRTNAKSPAGGGGVVIPFRRRRPSQ